MSHTRRSTWCSLRTLGAVRRCAILLRSGMVCTWCGGALTQANAQIDHFIPRALGGTSANSNLLAACDDCNGSRGSDSWPLPPGVDLSAPVDLAAGRRLALTWYPWLAKRLGLDKPPRELAQTPEAAKKRRQRARRRAANKEALDAGLAGDAFPFGGAS